LRNIQRILPELGKQGEIFYWRIGVNLEEMEFKYSSSKFVMIYADAVKTTHLTTVIGNSDFMLKATDFDAHSLDPNFEYHMGLLPALI
jgi:hypothetical protein